MVVYVTLSIRKKVRRYISLHAQNYDSLKEYQQQNVDLTSQADRSRQAEDDRLLSFQIEPVIQALTIAEYEFLN